MSNRLLAMLPGLLAAGALGAKQMGYFGGDQKTPEQILGKDTLAANNKDWQRFGHDPMQLPGAVAPSAVGDNATPAGRPMPFQRPSLSPNFPLSQAPMQMPNALSPVGAMPSNLLAAHYPVNPLPPQQPAPGLLASVSPDQRAHDFIQNQLHGTPMPSAPTMPTGGSSTPISNPFLYAQLYGNGANRLN